MEHRTLKMIRECAAEAGCEIVDISQGGKHIAVTVGKNGVIRRVTVSVSASDFRVARQITKDMKRMFHPHPRTPFHDQ